jgi:hypothetical protein
MSTVVSTTHGSTTQLNAKPHVSMTDGRHPFTNEKQNLDPLRP